MEHASHSHPNMTVSRAKRGFNVKSTYYPKFCQMRIRVSGFFKICENHKAKPLWAAQLAGGRRTGFENCFCQVAGAADIVELRDHRT